MRPKVAHGRIESFGKRFGEAHLYLAYHAAFPLALTPDLLYRLWANFQRDIHGQVISIPWIAVADLLLSGLCDEVGHELYELDAAVRNALLSRLKEDENLGQQRIKELSDFLLNYVQQQLHNPDPDLRDFAQAQHWVALAYTQPSEAASELAVALERAYEKDRADLVRLASLVKTLAEPLAEFEPLLVRAHKLESFAYGNQETVEVQFDKLHIQGVGLSTKKNVRQSASNSQSLFAKIAQTKNKLLAGGAILLIGLAGAGFQIYRQTTGPYAKLDNLLSAKQWKDADDETAQKMWEAVGRQKERSLRVEDFEKIPCEDLQTMDALWKKYSKEHYGFSVQSRIWQSSDVKANFDKFVARVGWGQLDKNGSSLAFYYYMDGIPFDLSQPAGHLPWAPTYYGGNNNTREKYISRIISCGI